MDMLDLLELENFIHYYQIVLHHQQVLLIKQILVLDKMY